MLKHALNKHRLSNILLLIWKCGYHFAFFCLGLGNSLGPSEVVTYTMKLEPVSIHRWYNQFIIICQRKNSNSIDVVLTPSKHQELITTHFQRECSTGMFIGHYDDVIMGAMASQITSLTIVYSTVYSGADQSKHQSSASLAFVRGIHRWPVNSPHKWPVTRKMFPFDDVIMDRDKNGHHSADIAVKFMFSYENCHIWSKFHWNVFPRGKCPINNKPAVVKIMAWHCTSDKPLSETIVV